MGLHGMHGQPYGVGGRFRNAMFYVEIDKEVISGLEADNGSIRELEAGGALEQ